MHFVPTMGGLHQGHGRLMAHARAVSADPCAVLASVYVNPLQFGAGEDFEQYPRDLDADCLVAAQAGVDALWCPTDAQIYPEGPEQVFRLQVPQSLQQHLCGASRPGHFDGVATVVTRLLSLVRPSVLVLGEKDWQQLTILRHLVKGLGLPVRVMGCPTVREPDGLASSSRNRYLTPDQRHQAAMLPRLLQQEATAVQSRSRALNTAALTTALTSAGFEVDYVEVVNPSTLQPAAADQTCRLLAVAARCGSTRLIDHTVLMTRSPIVAIDGPAGAGKSTVTRAFAERMGLLYLDTGAMYRAVTWWVLEQGLDPADAAAVAPSLQGLEVELDPLRDGVQAVRVNGNDVTDEIRDPRVTAKVSVVAAHACVRALLTAQQQRMGERGGLVAEGRDIGTAVFPDAELKVFLTATPAERARRRAVDLERRGFEVPALTELEAQIVERDHLDSTRDVAPLVQAADATELITDGMAIAAVIDALEDLFRLKVPAEAWPGSNA